MVDRSRIPANAVAHTPGPPQSIAEAFALHTGNKVEPAKLELIGRLAGVLAERNRGLSTGAAVTVLLGLIGLSEKKHDSDEPILTTDQAAAQESIWQEAVNAADTAAIVPSAAPNVAEIEVVPVDVGPVITEEQVA